MNTNDRIEGARQHLQDGERLVAALQELIDEQEAEGKSTEATERLLRAMVSTLERMRRCCS